MSTGHFDWDASRTMIFRLFVYFSVSIDVSYFQPQQPRVRSTDLVMCLDQRRYKIGPLSGLKDKLLNYTSRKKWPLLNKAS